MKKLVLILALSASAAYGEIYRWTDSKGTSHYTNSLYEIPERYRAKAKTVNLGLPDGKTEASPPQQTVPAAGSTQPAPVPVPPQASPPGSVSQTPSQAVAPRNTFTEERRVRTNRSHRRSSEDE